MLALFHYSASFLTIYFIKSDIGNVFSSPIYIEMANNMRFGDFRALKGHENLQDPLFSPPLRPRIADRPRLADRGRGWAYYPVLSLFKERTIFYDPIGTILIYNGFIGDFGIEGLQSLIDFLSFP